MRSRLDLESDALLPYTKHRAGLRSRMQQVVIVIGVIGTGTYLAVGDDDLGFRFYPLVAILALGWAVIAIQLFRIFRPTDIGTNAFTLGEKGLLVASPQGHRKYDWSQVIAIGEHKSAVSSTAEYQPFGLVFRTPDDQEEKYHFRVRPMTLSFEELRSYIVNQVAKESESEPVR